MLEYIYFKLLELEKEGLPWWSSGWDFALLVQGPWVWSLVRDAATKTQQSQINKNFLKN